MHKDSLALCLFVVDIFLYHHLTSLDNPSIIEDSVSVSMSRSPNHRLIDVFIISVRSNRCGPLLALVSHHQRPLQLAPTRPLLLPAGPAPHTIAHLTAVIRFLLIHIHRLILIHTRV